MILFTIFLITISFSFSKIYDPEKEKESRLILDSNPSSKFFNLTYIYKCVSDPVEDLPHDVQEYIK